MDGLKWEDEADVQHDSRDVVAYGYNRGVFADDDLGDHLYMQNDLGRNNRKVTEK